MKMNMKKYHVDFALLNEGKLIEFSTSLLTIVATPWK